MYKCMHAYISSQQKWFVAKEMSARFNIPHFFMYRFLWIVNGGIKIGRATIFAFNIPKEKCISVVN